MYYRSFVKSAIIISIALTPFLSLSLSSGFAQTSKNQNPSQFKTPRFAPPVLGKYGCSVNKYNSSTQMYEYSSKGTFTLLPGNAYRYNGFSKPSSGRYSFDAKSGKIRFHGGYFDKGEATPIPDYKNRYYLVTPTLPDHRWTCALIS